MSKKDLKKKEKEIRKEEEEQEEVSEEEALEEAAEKVASKISTALNLGELQKKIDKIVGRSAKVKQIYTANDVKKDVDKLSKEEVIIGFFKALVRPEGPDHAVLKALSEGVAADGGYLFPDEFRAELIREIADINIMRKLVRVVPMKRDILKIPKLESRPKVRWTSENAAKSTTTADFDEKTLTAYKKAAILYTSEELVEDCDTFDVVKLIISLFAEEMANEEEKVMTAGTGVGQPTGLVNCTITNVACSGNLDLKKSLSIKLLKENAINCWKLLTVRLRTISSQAYQMA